MSANFNRSMISLRHAHRPIYALVLLICFLTAIILPTACQIEPSMSFPRLETAHTSLPDGTATEGTEPDNTIGKLTLSVALPVGADALAALRLLYLAKKSGLLNQEAGQYIGQQINMEDLQQFDSDLRLNLQSVSLKSGATQEQLATWEAAANMPDIVYCRALNHDSLNAFQDLSGYLYGNQLLAATNIEAAILKGVQNGQRLFGLPFLASTPVVLMNLSLLSQYAVAPPGSSWHWADWRTLTETMMGHIQAAGLAADADALARLAETPDDLNALLASAQFIIDDPENLLNYLPASVDPSVGWAAWDGQSFAYNSPSFINAADWLKQALPAGASPSHLDENQLQIAFSGQNSIQSGRVLMWLGDSADMSDWQKQTAFQTAAYLMPVHPLASASEPADITQADRLLSQRLPVRISALMVSRNCHYPALAADIATFLALDADSLLMQHRFQNYEGCVPVIRDEYVWQTLVGEQASGSLLLMLRERMPYAYCSGELIQTGWDAVIRATIGQYGSQLLAASDPAVFSSLIEQMKAAAQTARGG